MSFSDNNNVTLSATTPRAADDFSPPSYNVTVTKPQVVIKNTQANNAAGGGDQSLAQVFAIAAAASVTIDLTSFTNVAGQTASSFARLKYLMVRLLSPGDDAAGTLCSGIQLAPGATNGWTGVFGTATSTIVLGNGDVFKWETQKAAGVTVDATHKTITLTNSDASLVAKVQVIAVGGST